jgi:hypothetical protein
VESTKIMKNPTIIAHSARHGFGPGASHDAAGRRTGPPDRLEVIAVVISPSAQLSMMVTRRAACRHWELPHSHRLLQRNPLLRRYGGGPGGNKSVRQEISPAPVLRARKVAAWS